MEWIKERIVFFEPKEVHYLIDVKCARWGKVVQDTSGISACLIQQRNPLLNTMKTFATIEDAKGYIEEIVGTAGLSQPIKHKNIDRVKSVHCYDGQGRHLKRYQHLRTALLGENLTIEDIAGSWIEFREQILIKKGLNRYFSHSYFTTLEKTLTHETRT